MTTDDLVMPAAVHQELDQLLATIKRATTSDEAERAGIRAEGFVPGVERLKALQPHPSKHYTSSSSRRLSGEWANSPLSERIGDSPQL